MKFKIIENKYEAVVPNKVYDLKKTIKTFKDNLKLFQKAKDVKELNKMLNDVFVDFPFKFFIETHAIPQVKGLNYKMPFTAQHQPDKKEKAVLLGFDDMLLQKIKKGDIKDILGQFRFDIPHEFVHYTQFHPESGKLKKDFEIMMKGDYFDELEEAMNTKGDQEKHYKRFYEIMDTIDNDKPIPKWVKEEGLDWEKIIELNNKLYFFNPSEFPAYAFSTIGNLINAILEGDIKLPKINKESIIKFIDSLTLENYKKYKKYSWTLFNIFPVYWKNHPEKQEQLLDLMKKLVRKLPDEYFEK